MTDQTRDNLKFIFDYETSNNDLPEEIKDLMKFITTSENHFNAFHTICAFLIMNHTNEFLSCMGIKAIHNITLEKIMNQIPKNLIN